MEFFDDFADFNFNFGIGNDDSSATEGESSLSVLQQRFQKLELSEQVIKQQISDNWKDGYWGVWGCSLDPYSTIEDESSQKIVVTCVRQMPFSDGDGADDVNLLIVGRSDGSICWLQMEVLSPLDSDAKSSVESRSLTTYFETKLVAKATEDGGMVVDKALQRQENGNGENDGGVNNDADDPSRSPFEILAQIQTGTSSAAAIVDMLPIAAAKMVWTIAHDTPNIIQGWKLTMQSDSGYLVPIDGSSSQPSQIDIEAIHTSPIVSMKIIPKSQDDFASIDDHGGSELVVSVSDNGQVVVWEVSALGDADTSPCIRVRLDAHLLQQEEYSLEDSVEPDNFILSMDVDDKYLYVGNQGGRISIFDLSELWEPNDLYTTDVTGPLTSLPLLKSFIAFTNKNPGVSTILAAGPGSLGMNTANVSSDNGVTRPPTKSLIVGNMNGGLKQWDLIPAGKGRLEYWPRMASQKLPGGKPHVYETREDYNYEEDDESGECFSSAIRGLLCIQQVLLAATDHDLTVWDSTTGKALYDMRGLDFLFGRPSLLAVENSVLVTNGMENFVCVHDFAMDRVTSENVDNFLERDENAGGTDESENSGDEIGKSKGDLW